MRTPTRLFNLANHVRKDGKKVSPFNRLFSFYNEPLRLIMN